MQSQVNEFILAYWSQRLINLFKNTKEILIKCLDVLELYKNITWYCSSIYQSLPVAFLGPGPFVPYWLIDFDAIDDFNKYILLTANLNMLA